MARDRFLRSYRLDPAVRDSRQLALWQVHCSCRPQLRQCMETTMGQSFSGLFHCGTDLKQLLSKATILPRRTIGIVAERYLQGRARA